MGSYTWKQSDGLTTDFRADGKLDYLQDTNGNKITAGYDADGPADQPHALVGPEPHDRVQCRRPDRRDHGFRRPPGDLHV